jgi:2'-5' RNA ligase
MNQETAVIIPVAGLPPVIEDLRLRHDPTARAGVPAHVTILHPFLAPELITDERLAELEALLAGFAAFDFSLVALRGFGDGTVYLAPDPERPFADMTARVSADFGVAPYRGAYAEVVPHLTLAQAAGEAERGRIDAELAPVLPLTAAASVAWLLVGSTDTEWTVCRSFPLGIRAAGPTPLRSAGPGGSESGAAGTPPRDAPSETA